MALTSENNSITVEGNESTTDHYPVSFKALSAEHIRVEVKAAGEDEYTLLTAGQYTVHGTAPDSFTVTTAVAYPDTTLVTIFRWVPLKQGLVLPLAGSLPGPGIERSLDLLVMQLQQIYRLVTGFGTVSAPHPLTEGGLKIFADAEERGETVPDFAGQAGVQLDTRALYIATGESAGAWGGARPAFPAVRVFANASERNAAEPDFAGQLAYVAGYELPFRGTATTPNAWAEINAGLHANWTATPWRHDEILVADEMRWAGHLGHTRKITAASVSVAKPGTGNLAVQIYLGGAAGLEAVADASLVLTPGESFMDAGPDAAAHIRAAVLAATYSANTAVSVKVVNVGEELTVNTSAGSTQSTPASLASISTGTRLVTPNVSGEVFLVAVNGDGSARMSHPAGATGTGTAARTAGRIFVRGIFPTMVSAGEVDVPTDEVTASLLREGDLVVGPTVQPGTVIKNIATDGTSITLSQALAAETNALTVVSETRLPVMHYTAISAAAAAESITLPVTTHIRAGDSVIGTDVAAGTIVTAKSGSAITLSEPLEDDITEVTVTYPVRTGTASAGSASVTLNTGTVPRGSLVTGAGIPNGSYLSNLSGTTATLSKPVSMALAGTRMEFSRDEIQVVNAAAVASSATLTLPYAVADTAIEAGFMVEGAEFQPGTKVSEISGSTITLNKPAAVTNAAAAVKFHRHVPWRGLSISLTGTAQPS